MKFIFVNLLFLFAIESYCQFEVAHQYLFKDVTIIDVTNGSLLAHRWIGIDNDRISQIYDSRVIPSLKTVVLNGSGKFV